MLSLNVVGVVHVMGLLKHLPASIMLGLVLGFAQMGLAQKTSNGPQGQGDRRHKETKVAKHPVASEADGYVNGHGYVDLGLPSGTLWATCNVGASEPMQKGGYYQFGKVGEYRKGDNKSWEVPAKSDISGTEYDAATFKMQLPWCIPSKEDWAELSEHCDWRYIGNYGKTGKACWMATGRNGKKVLFPLHGFVDFRGEITCAGHNGDMQEGFYWGEELRQYSNFKDGCTRVWLYASRVAEVKPDIHVTGGHLGLQIRPVMHK